MKLRHAAEKAAAQILMQADDDLKSVMNASHEDPTMAYHCEKRDGKLWTLTAS